MLLYIHLSWKCFSEAAALATGFPAGFVSAGTPSLWLKAVQLPL